MLRLVFTAVAFGAAFFMTSAAKTQQQVPCGSRAKIAAILSEYGEQVVYRGIVNGAVFELYSAASGSWTATITTTTETTCLVAAGEGGAVVRPARAKKGEET